MMTHELTVEQVEALLSAGRSPQASAQLSPPLLEARAFLSLTDAQLRVGESAEGGRFIAESLTLLEGALELGLPPLAVLTSAKWRPRVERLAERFASQMSQTLLLEAPLEALERLTGYNMHRGTLASFKRPPERSVEEVAREGSLMVVLEDLVDHANIGAVCRSVVGLGAGGLLLTPRCADPLYRRSLRVSMGAALRTPWARAESLNELCHTLKAQGFTLVALSLSERSLSLRQLIAAPPAKVALLLGAEGAGLSEEARALADHEVYIEMSGGVESLNVASAAAVAMWALKAT